MDIKKCNTCGVEKELSSFYSSFDKRRGRKYTFAACRSCASIRSKKWVKDNPETVRLIQKRNQAKNGKKFYQNQVEKRKKNWIAYSHQRKKWERNRNKARWDLADKLVESQNNSCAICKLKFNELYDIDHSHETGLVRGLLCRKCNSGLHYFENKEFIEKAEQYLKNYPAIDFPPTKY